MVKSDVDVKPWVMQGSSNCRKSHAIITQTNSDSLVSLWNQTSDWYYPLARRFYCLHDDKLQRENCLKKYGKAHKSSLIFIIICFFLSFTTTSLTAILSVHFKAASDQQITFVPGEVNKHLTFEIINNSNKGSKTFQVIFSNPQRSVLIALRSQARLCNNQCIPKVGKSSCLLIIQWHGIIFLLWKLTLYWVHKRQFSG